jgi:hypothetical protein
VEWLGQHLKQQALLILNGFDAVSDWGAGPQTLPVRFNWVGFAPIEGGNIPFGQKKNYRDSPIINLEEKQSRLIYLVQSL